MKNLLIVFIIFSINLYTFSQTSFGIKTGLNLSHAKYLDDGDEQLIKPYRKLKPGFVTGIVFNSKLNEVLSVQTEILYSQKGLQFEQQPHSKGINSMNYIEVPLSGHYKIAGTSFSEFNAYIGGYIAYWTDGKYKYTELSSGEKDVQKVDFNNPDYKYNRIDAGILGGFAYRINKTTLFVRYLHSMAGSSEINADALTNRVISIGLIFLVIN